MNKPKLWIMCGLRGSGRSTIAAKLTAENPNTIIISTDEIREELTGDRSNQDHSDEVFRLFHDRIRKNLENKYNVIADNTNITMKSRRAILAKVNGLNIEKICYVIPKPIELCKFDNQSREHPVPEYVLDKQIGKFQIPFFEEGFDQLIIHRDSAWKGYQMDGFKLFLAMWGYDQKNPHHNMMLDDHCLNTYKLFCGKIQHNTLLNLEYINGYAMGAKLHDFGKMMTQTFDEDGVAHYFGHAEVGSYFILSQMIIPAAWTKNELLDCCFLINYHMMPFGWTNEKSKRKWQRRFGEYKYKMLMDFNECDRAR